MDPITLQSLPYLRDLFGKRLQENVPLANYTAARVGGPADVLLAIRSADELGEAVTKLWANQVPFVILGSAANVLVSDLGVRGVVLLNRASATNFDVEGKNVSVWAESGTNLGLLARQAATKGFSGLEWASTIPGSVGGAVYGNAGAHGGDMAGSLILANILHRTMGRKDWSSQEMGYAYRSSVLKRNPQSAVVLAARLSLTIANIEAVKSKMEEFGAYRKQTQPPGASLGSMFKTPAGDHAGRLIESSGLKGIRVGGVEVSRKHGNFFINDDRATARDYRDLIDLVRRTVEEKQGVSLELEIELIGEWDRPTSKG